MFISVAENTLRSTESAARRRVRLAAAFFCSLAINALLLLIPIGNDRYQADNEGGESSAGKKKRVLAVNFYTASDAVALPPKPLAPSKQTASVKAPEAVKAPEQEYPVVNGLIAGPWYYTARYLHRRPSPLKPIRPAYPEEADSVRGTVVIRLLISPEGSVDSYKIEAATPEGLFEASVVEAFAKASYVPGAINGQAVRSQLLIEVSFEPGLSPQPNFLLIESAPSRPFGHGLTSSLGKGN